jgi:serine/threonine-protein kinase
MARPKRTLAIGVWLLCLAAFAGSVAWLAPHLPLRVASHFDLAGRADGWSSRTSYLRFIVGFGWGISGALAGLFYAARFFPAETFNVPNAGYWRSEAHFSEACDFLCDQGFWLAGPTCLWVGALNFLIVRANQVPPPRLDPLAVAGLAALLVGGLVLWLRTTVTFFKRATPRAR